MVGLPAIGSADLQLPGRHVPGAALRQGGLGPDGWGPDVYPEAIVAEGESKWACQIFDFRAHGRSAWNAGRRVEAKRAPKPRQVRLDQREEVAWRSREDAGSVP